MNELTKPRVRKHSSFDVWMSDVPNPGGFYRKWHETWTAAMDECLRWWHLQQRTV